MNTNETTNATEILTVRCLVCPDRSPGYLPWFAHVDGGICYACEGEGTIEVPAFEGVQIVPVERVEPLLDVRLSSGEVVRAYALRDGFEVALVRPEVGCDDERFSLGCLFFFGPGDVRASDGLKYADVRELPIEDKRKIYAAAVAVHRAAAA